MSNFKWCHGPKCHELQTQDRIRGVKGSKVLRTRKVKQTEWNKSPFGQGGGNTWAYFCSQSCLMDFMHKHIQQVVAIAPRNEPLETPINDPKKTVHTSDYTHPDGTHHTWTSTEIKEKGVDTQIE